MKQMLSFLLLGLMLAGCDENVPKPDTALRPPMGWNSYDCYDWRVNEIEFKSNVDFMADHLKASGYEYAVVDFLWHLHDPDGGRPTAERRRGLGRQVKYGADGLALNGFSMDAFGRVLPDTVRFPSAREGRGFKPLADYCHERGLKFGIHIMRGIPREAVHRRLPVNGTGLTAADIAEPADTCSWERSMYGIDHEKPGAQDYYDSLFKLYASWGVDFVKADDTMYPVFHKEEIRLISNAMKSCSRPMVLSLSLGEIPHVHEKFVQSQAHMWRISDDFWDSWPSLLKKFDLTDAWSNRIAPNSWPDADMLPIGHLCLLDQPKGKERISRFNEAEQRSMMTLWAMARSPLMIGSDLPSMPESTLKLLTNSQVLAVNQNSYRNRLVYKDWLGTVIWLADVPDSEERYLALFNTADEERIVNFDFDLEYLRRPCLIRDLWRGEDMGCHERHFEISLPAHGAGLYRVTPVQE